MNFSDFLDLAQKYQAMGWSVQNQMADLMDDQVPIEDLNPNALRMFRELVEEFDRITEGGDEDSFNVVHAIKEHLGEE